MECASQLLKKLIKTTVCKAFSFHESFRIVKTSFVSRVAPIEIHFRVTAVSEKSVGNSIDSIKVLKCADNKSTVANTSRKHRD
jgi:hypothetical protein